MSICTATCYVKWKKQVQRAAYHTVSLVWNSTKGNVSSIGGLATDLSPSCSPYCFWGQWLCTIVTWVTLKDRHRPGSSLRLFHSLWASDCFTRFSLNTNIPKKKKKVSQVPGTGVANCSECGHWDLWRSHKCSSSLNYLSGPFMWFTTTVLPMFVMFIDFNTSV